MKPTLRIEIIELFGGNSDFDKQEVYESIAGSTLHDCDLDMFFLLDADNYKNFCEYFSIQLTDEQRSEIYSCFQSDIFSL